MTDRQTTHAPGCWSWQNQPVSNPYKLQNSGEAMKKVFGDDTCAS